MRFVLQVLFPIALIFGPRLLVGKPLTIIAVGLASGFAMAALSIFSTGPGKAFSGGEKAARVYLWMALGIGALTAALALFVSNQVDALASRPGIQASVSIMPWVVGGSAVAFALAAALTWRQKRPA